MSFIEEPIYTAFAFAWAGAVNLAIHCVIGKGYRLTPLVQQNASS